MSCFLNLFRTTQSLSPNNPLVMGVINITDESFCEESRCKTPQEALARAQRLVEDGADIIDVGGEATNPAEARWAAEALELQRVIPVVELLVKELEVPISVDTSRASVMREVVACGAKIINDVRALRCEGAMAAAAELNVPVCLMHMHYWQKSPERGAPEMQTPDIVAEVKDFLQTRVAACLAAGIRSENIILDPGIGHGAFGKNTQQNLQLLKRLNEFSALGYPLLVGVSRKTFIGELLAVPESKRVAASVAATIIAVQNGAQIVRTHDVKETVDALKIINAIEAVP